MFILGNLGVNITDCYNNANLNTINKYSEIEKSNK